MGFPLGRPAGAEDIVDREDFLETLGWQLREGHSIVLAAPRRMGKSSICLEALRQARDAGMTPIAVDLFLCQSLREFATELSSACLATRTGAVHRSGRQALVWLNQLLSIERIAITLPVGQVELLRQAERADPWELLDQALALVGSLPERSSTRRAVVLLDEFQEAKRLGGEALLRRLRGMMQAQQDVAYLFTGSEAGLMRRLFGQTRQAFFRFAYPLELPSVPEAAWREYLRRKFTELGISITEAALASLLGTTGGHPYDTMAVATEALALAERLHLTELNAEVTAEALHTAESRLAATFTAELQGLGPRAREVLQRIAGGVPVFRDAPQPTTANRTLHQLVDGGVLERNGRGRYSFREPMLAAYLRRAPDLWP